MNDAPDFTISHYLDKGKTWCGLPNDEVIPGALVFVLFLLTHHEVIGLALAFSWLMGLRTLKHSLGAQVLIVTVYEYAPHWLHPCWFQRTPPACDKYWLG